MSKVLNVLGQVQRTMAQDSVTSANLTTSLKAAPPPAAPTPATPANVASSGGTQAAQPKGK
jgi:hypothetical protein